jgi:Skp family chaperone for outer membrane proteins
MRKLLWTAALAGTIAAGVVVLALPGNAQRPARPAKADSGIGFVDLGQVTDKIKDTNEWKVNVKRFEDDRTRYRNEIEELARLRFLSQAEIEELKALRAKQKPTDGEKARISELEGKSAQMDQEYQRLAMTEKPNQEEQDRLRQLTQMREQASTAIQTEYDKRAAELQKLEGEMLDKMQKRILDVVGQVAERQNLQLVVDRQAVLYGGTDLTQEVLKRLGS